jgi:hypothetical protein
MNEATTFCLDAGQTVPVTPGSPVTSITTADQLEGMQVSLVIDGADYSGVPVSGGQIVLPAAAQQSLYYGIPFLPQLQGVHAVVPGGKDIQGKRKKISSGIVRVSKSRAFQIGANQPVASTVDGQPDTTWTNMHEIDMNLPADWQGEHSLFTGDVYGVVDDDWEMQTGEASWGMMAFQQVRPFPMSILSYVANIEIGDDEN